MIKKQRLGTSYKGKISLSIIFMGVIPLLILGLFLMLFIQVRTNIFVEESVITTLNNANVNITKEIHENIDIVNNIAQEATQLDEVESEEIRTLLFQHLRSNAAMIDMHIIFNDKELSDVSTKSIPRQYTLPMYYNWGIYKNTSKIKSEIYPNSFWHDSRLNMLSIVKEINIAGHDAFIIMDISRDYFINVLQSNKTTAFGSVSFIITDDYGEVLYNDTMYTSSLKFIDNALKNNNGDTKYDDDVIVATQENNFGLKLYGFLSQNVISSQGDQIIAFLILALILVLAVSIMVGIRLANSISQPIIDLAENISNLDFEGNELLDLDLKDAELLFVQEKTNELILSLNDSYQLGIEKSELLKETEIKMLMSQINPHFLYNTLDVIKWKSRLDEVDDIERIVTNLGVLLRGAMNHDDVLITVNQEIEFIKSYIEIQKFRYDDRIKFILNVDQYILDHKIPKFILQPLVENAIIHGIEPKGTGGSIEVSGYSDDDNLYFTVIDNGVGSSIEMIEIDKEKHIGLQNIDKRLKLQYGERYHMIWTSAPGLGTRVFIEIPKQDGGKSDV